MSENDRVILGQLLKDRKQAEAPDQTESEYFEYFAAGEILKDFDLDSEEIISGLVAGANDGGLDGMFILVNGTLVTEDYVVPRLSRSVQIDVVLVQAKKTNGFEEEPLNKLVATVSDLLDLTKSTKVLGKTYNEEVCAATDRFRTMHKELLSAFPELSFRVVYGTLGAEVHPNVKRKTDQVRQAIKRHFPDAKFRFEFLGSRELLALARKQPRQSFDLRFIEQTISAKGPSDYLCLVNLAEYSRFITDEDGSLLVRLFEANVRDYQVNAEVNKGLRDSLENASDEDFWWLNNGVTILAAQATQSGKVLTIEDPQIVNGLQTSREIFEFFRKNNTQGTDPRNLLVRVVIPTSEASRDRIIKATNSQTPIPHASLRATDPLHRNIEDHFRSRGLFYDRKKGFYRNLGKPLRAIVTIPYLAQSVLAIALRRPNDARARPSSVLREDEMYDEIFSSSYPLDLFTNCVEIMRRVEGYLRHPERRLSRAEQNDLRFYVAMHAVMMATRKVAPKAIDIAKLKISSITDGDLQRSLAVVWRAYFGLGATDQAAKGTELVKKIIASFQRSLIRSRR